MSTGKLTTVTTAPCLICENLSFVTLGALAPGSRAILSASLPHLLIGRVGTVAAMRRSHVDAISPRATLMLFDEPWVFPQAKSTV